MKASHEILEVFLCLMPSLSKVFAPSRELTVHFSLQQDEDMSLLVQEMQQGYSDLEKIQELYSETLVMDWWYNRGKEGDSK